MRATIPRSRSQARCSAEKYALSARSLTGRRRCGPRRDRTAGMPRMSGLRARLSWMFAPDTATASGTLWATDSTCSLLPFLPRSTGFGPVSDPPSFAANGGRVDERRGPVHLAPGPEFVQHRPVQPTPQAGLGPYREAAMRGGGRRVERRRQTPPGTAAGQRVHHCREHGPLVNGAVPPPCARAANDGSNGAASCQSSSGTRRFDGSAPTTGIMPRTNIKSRETTSKP